MLTINRALATRVTRATCAALLAMLIGVGSAAAADPVKVAINIPLTGPVAAFTLPYATAW